MAISLKQLAPGLSPADRQLNSAVGVGVWWQWLKQNATAVSAVASLIGSVLAFVAISVSAYTAWNQLHITALSFESSMIYQIQKDTRSLGLAYSKGTAQASEIFATMQSIYLQHEIKTIPDAAWDVFQKDFCSIMSTQDLQRAWDAERKDYYSDAFIRYMSALYDKGALKCREKSE